MSNYDAAKCAVDDKTSRDSERSAAFGLEPVTLLPHQLHDRTIATPPRHVT
jgi:hypothetical protein